MWGFQHPHENHYFIYFVHLCVFGWVAQVENLGPMAYLLCSLLYARCLEKCMGQSKYSIYLDV